VRKGVTITHSDSWTFRTATTGSLKAVALNEALLIVPQRYNQMLASAVLAA
jgi:hypothetical protein